MSVPFEIGGGISFGGGITIQLPPNVPPGVTYIDTENLERLLTENSYNLVTEDSVVATAPILTSANVYSGPNSGGTSVSLTGSGFTGVTSMAIAYPGFVSNPVVTFTVVSDTQISFITPANGYVPGSGYVIRATNTLGTGELPGWTYT